MQKVVCKAYITDLHILTVCGCVSLLSWTFLSKNQFVEIMVQHPDVMNVVIPVAFEPSQSGKSEWERFGMNYHDFW